MIVLGFFLVPIAFVAIVLITIEALAGGKRRIKFVREKTHTEGPFR